MEGYAGGEDIESAVRRCRVKPSTEENSPSKATSSKCASHLCTQFASGAGTDGRAKPCVSSDVLHNLDLRSQTS